MHFIKLKIIVYFQTYPADHASYSRKVLDSTDSIRETGFFKCVLIYLRHLMADKFCVTDSSKKQVVLNVILALIRIVLLVNGCNIYSL